MNLGLVTTSRRGRASTRLVAGGTVGLRSAGCSTSRLDVFAVLLLVILALVAGGDLLRRVLAHRRVQPEPLLRLGNTVIIDFGCENADVGALGDRRSSRAIAGLTSSSSASASIRQVRSWSRLSPGYHARTNSNARPAPRRAADAFQASKRPTATSSQSAVRLGVRGIVSPGQRAASTCTPARWSRRSIR